MNIKEKIFLGIILILFLTLSFNDSGTIAAIGIGGLCFYTPLGIKAITRKK